MGKVRVWFFQTKLDVEIESDRFDLTTECLMVTDTKGVLYGFPLTSILYWTSDPSHSGYPESPADAAESEGDLATGARCTCKSFSDPDERFYYTRLALNPRCPAHATQHLLAYDTTPHFAIDCPGTPRCPYYNVGEW